MKNRLLIFISIIFILPGCKKEITPKEPAPVIKPPVVETPKVPVVGQVASYDGKIPKIYLSTYGNTIMNEPKIKSRIKVIVNDTITLVHDIGIEYRGSTSLYFEQKSFGFEFWDASNSGVDSVIMDLPKEEDFILYAPANDKSLLRNVITYNLSNQIGMYATRTRFVQLYINDAYNGLYVLMEKIKRNKNRVNVSKVSAADVTGGYIIKVDKSTGDSPSGTLSYTSNISWRSRYDTAGNLISFLPFGPKKGEETYFLYEYPKADDITSEQKEYIAKYVDDFETALRSKNYKDPSTGYRAYIDVPSFVDFFLLNELSHNPDGYRLSTFMNKDKGGKLKMGPIWDFNLGFGNDFRTPISAVYNWGFNFNEYYRSDPSQVPFWWKRLLADNYFATAVKNRWLELRANKFSDNNILKLIDDNIALLQKHTAIDQHFTRWKFLGVRLEFNGFVGQTYQEEVDYLKNWVRSRAAWMDQNIPGL